MQSIIKEIAETMQIETASSHSFKVVVINEADGLTKDAQHALRRTMEKYIKNLRVILCCSNMSKILPPIRSRCLCLKVPSPTDEQIVDVLEDIGRKENIQIPKSFSHNIAIASDGNLRKAVLMLESNKMKQYPFSEGQKIELCDWERYIQDLASSILLEQSPARLQASRDHFYTLLSHCIPPSEILKVLLLL